MNNIHLNLPMNNNDNKISNRNNMLNKHFYKYPQELNAVDESKSQNNLEMEYNNQYLSQPNNYPNQSNIASRNQYQQHKNNYISKNFNQFHQPSQQRYQHKYHQYNNQQYDHNSNLYPTFSLTSIKPAYIQFRNTTNHAELSMIPLSYTISDQNYNQTDIYAINNKFSKKSQQKILISIQNKLKNQSIKKKQLQKQKTFVLSKIVDKEIDQIPINQYLNYDLSQQINVGIKNAQVLAEQIKIIRQQKRAQRNLGNVNTKNVNLNNNTTLGQNKNIRIKIFHGFNKNFRGIYQNTSKIVRV